MADAGSFQFFSQISGTGEDRIFFAASDPHERVRLLEIGRVLFYSRREAEAEDADSAEQIEMFQADAERLAQRAIR